MPIIIVGQKENTRAAALRVGAPHSLGGCCGLISAEFDIRLTAAAHATCIETPVLKTWTQRLCGFLVRDARRLRLDSQLTELIAYADGVAAVPTELRFTHLTKDGRQVRMALVVSLNPMPLGIIALESELG